MLPVYEKFKVDNNTIAVENNYERLTLCHLLPGDKLIRVRKKLFSATATQFYVEHRLTDLHSSLTFIYEGYLKSSLAHQDTLMKYDLRKFSFFFIYRPLFYRCYSTWISFVKKFFNQSLFVSYERTG